MNTGQRLLEERYSWPTWWEHPDPSRRPEDGDSDEDRAYRRGLVDALTDGRTPIYRLDDSPEEGD